MLERAADNPGQWAPLAVTPPPELIRTCDECRRELPISAFAKAAGGIPLNICAVCAGGFNYDQLQKKSKQQQQLLQQFVTQMRGEAINSPHISQLCESMYAVFGGMEGFVLKFKEQFDEAVARKPGSQGVINMLAVIVKLTAASTQYRGTAPDIAGMTDDQIIAEMQDMMGRVVKVDARIAQDEQQPEPAVSGDGIGV